MSELKKSDTKESVTINTANEIKYTKSNIVKSEYYKSKRDLLNTLLDDDISYSKTEIENIINKYLKKKVE